jgi:hypothetical protein
MAIAIPRIIITAFVAPTTYFEHQVNPCLPAKGFEDTTRRARELRNPQVNDPIQSKRVQKI